MATDIWSGGLPVLISLLVLSHLVFSQTTQVTSEVQKKELAIEEEDGGLSIESKVLGPLRIWHLVFLVVTFLLIIITIVCCCCDVRVPRTRQEIEEGYKKRIDNENYVKYLDHLPENILKNRPTARAKEKEDVDDPPARPQRIVTLGDAVMSAVPKTKLTRGGQVAVATPLAASAGVLAAMSKMRQNARSRPKQTEMAKSMTTLPKPERTRHK